jgi:spermidine synthase
MLHGGIIHGGQLLGDAYRNTPSDYFGPGSGYGRLFAALNERKPGPRRVGIIGLGAGVVASYGRPGDTFTFYEISPRVLDVARSEFTFLRDTPAKTEVVLGDGRLSLEREAPRRYDVLGIDAFSGDSIPMHLVTREAMAQYVRHLAPDGVIVFQATNRYIDLLPIVKRLAAEVGMEAVVVSDAPAGSDSGPEYWLSATDQILVTRNRELFTTDALRYVATPISDRGDLATFTDAHHNMFRILK